MNTQHIDLKQMEDIVWPFHSENATEAPVVIAGPCSAESRVQVMQTAHELADAGIRIFRAGLWKPRTMPGGFEGVGKEGLPWLSEVKKVTGMQVATEVATRAHTLKALQAGIDILWLGARTTSNPFAVQEIANTLRRYAPTNVTVIVKNPISPDLQLWIGALQRIYNAGIRRLVAVHRGFTGYNPHIYRNIPEWHVPIELRLRYPRLPLLCDPSHIGGKREIVASLAQQALDMGFDGLMIESHCAPDKALSDAAQQVTPSTLAGILRQLVLRSETDDHRTPLQLLRKQIDTLDDELLETLSRRLAVCRSIGEYKRKQGMKAMQLQRFSSILEHRENMAADLSLDPKFLRSILLLIHDESIRQQIEILNKDVE